MGKGTGKVKKTHGLPVKCTKQHQQQERELADEWTWHQCEQEKLLEIDNGIWKEDGTLIKRKVWLSAF
jgi:hypothetical protein